MILHSIHRVAGVTIIVVSTNTATTDSTGGNLPLLGLPFGVGSYLALPPRKIVIDLPRLVTPRETGPPLRRIRWDVRGKAHAVEVRG